MPLGRVESIQPHQGSWFPGTQGAAWWQARGQLLSLLRETDAPGGRNCGESAFILLQNECAGGQNRLRRPPLKEGRADSQTWNRSEQKRSLWMSRNHLPEMDCSEPHYFRIVLVGGMCESYWVKRWDGFSEKF